MQLGHRRKTLVTMSVWLLLSLLKYSILVSNPTPQQLILSVSQYDIKKRFMVKVDMHFGNPKKKMGL